MVPATRVANLFAFFLAKDCLIARVHWPDLPSVFFVWLVLLPGPVASLSIMAAELPAHRYTLDTIIDRRSPTTPLCRWLKGVFMTVVASKSWLGPIRESYSVRECWVRRDTRYRAGEYQGFARSRIAGRV